MYLVVIHIWMCTAVVGIGRLYSSVIMSYKRWKIL